MKLTVTSIYSLIHFIVDMSCAVFLTQLVIPICNLSYSTLVVILIYNFFAFAFQLPFGIIADKINKNSTVSLFGIIFILLSFIVYNLNVILAIVVIGIGNALFHIGGGIDVLNISKGKNALSGIYVSTGAVGLYLGTKVLRYSMLYLSIIFLIISILLLLFLYLKNNKTYHITNEEFKIDINKKEIVIICLMLTICIRSYVGMILNYDFKQDFILGLVFVFMVAFRKNARWHNCR